MHDLSDKLTCNYNVDRHPEAIELPQPMMILNIIDFVSWM